MAWKVQRLQCSQLPNLRRQLFQPDIATPTVTAAAPAQGPKRIAMAAACKKVEAKVANIFKANPAKAEAKKAAKRAAKATSAEGTLQA